MKLKDEKKWNNYVKKNTDSYGGACIVVAKRVMEILDKGKPFDPHEIICTADDETGTGGITGFMAGVVAQIVSQCHERGEEFRKAWNKEIQLGDEGEKANESGGILNPAILNIEKK